MSMHNPKMYEKFNVFQKRDAIYCLQKFGNKLNLTENVSVIDLGCGDGSVTDIVLEKFLNKNYKKITGVDISEEMVDYANDKYGNAKISFSIMDLGGELPEKFKQSFDVAFSNYAVQFVANQEKVFHNVYDLLKEGGSCLLQFLGRNKLFDAYIVLSKREKWSKWFKNMDNFVIRYQYIEYAANILAIDGYTLLALVHLRENAQEREGYIHRWPRCLPRTIKDTEGEVRRLMSESGFKDIHVEVTFATYEFDSVNDLMNMVQSANLMKIETEALLEQFMIDFRQLVSEMEALTKLVVEGKPDAVAFSYDRIIAFGTK